MFKKTTKLNLRFFVLHFFFALLAGYTANAQIYYHNFGTTTINTHPYTAAPTTINPNLSGSSWANSTPGGWASTNGATGQALQLFNAAGTTTITLTLNVAPSQQVTVNSFSFWSQRTASAPQQWSMAINGIQAGSGVLPQAPTATGTLNVTNPVSGITGTMTVTLTLSGATGNGNMRLDDFRLNGSLSSTCTSAVVTSFTPLTGPKDTMVTITGSGFTDTQSVKFDGINAVFTVLSDTEIQAMVPAGVNTGVITVTATDGCTGTGPVDFTVLKSDCQSPEIYISEIYDAYNGVPGCIELYNPGTTPVNLAGYRLLRYGNINSGLPPDYDMHLIGTINPGATFMVCIDISSVCPGVPTDFPLQNGINANDEFELIHPNGELIDNAQVTLGTSDTAGRGYSIIRKPNAVAPKAVFNVNDWNVYGTEFCTNLNMHTANPVSAPLPIINHPAPRTICVGTNTTFPASVIPATGFTFQWKRLTGTGIWVNVTNDSNHSGANTATLTINNATLAMNGNQYYLEATSATCVVRTDVAQLYVLEPPVAPTLAVIQPNCTTPAGTISVTAPSDPDGTLTYSRNGINYQPDPEFSGLAPGSYTITIKNAAGCVSQGTIQVINPVPGAPDAPALTAEQPDCDTATGTVTITAPVGSGHTYSKDGINYVSSPVFAGLVPGSYNFTVRLNGCTSAITVQIINAAPGTPATPDVTAIQPTCGNPGSITVTAPVGAGLSYSKDGINYQPGTTFDNLSPGTSYSITVKNAAGCVSPARVQAIDAIPSAPAQPVVTATQPDCDTATGSIMITSPLGAGLTYSINGVDYVNDLTYTLTPGTYNITVKNAAGCVSVARVQLINSQPQTPAAPAVTAGQPGCGEERGSITVNTPIGAGLEYSKNGTDYQTGTTFNNLDPATYTITVRNAEGCVSAATTQTINAGMDMPSAPVLNVNHPDCVTTTGSITVTTPAPGAGITYSKNGSDYQTGATFDNLTPGATYSITVKNWSGCVSTATVQVINVIPSAPAAAVVTHTNPDCGTPTGSITITSPLGAGLTYSIDGINYHPYPSAVFATVAPGDYNLTVKNAAGCISAPTNIVINDQPATPAAPAITFTQPDCDTPNGSITVTAPTGTGFTFSKDGTNYVSNPVFTGLIAGSYNITVKSPAGCVSPITVKVIDSAPSTPNAPALTFIQPDCITATGSITVTVPTGNGLEYSKDGTNYQSQTTFNNLTPGASYTITVRNAAGCVSPGTVQAIAPIPAAPDAPALTFVQPGCTSMGSITVTSPVGSNLTYSRNGVDYSTNPTFGGLSAGTYNITVKNAAGCVSAATVQIIDPAPAIPPQPVVISGQPDCDTPTGSITVTNPGGAGFTYSRNGVDYQTDPIFYDVPPGTYSITTKSPQGCISIAAMHVILPAPATPTAPTVTITQPDCVVTTATATITPSTGGTFEYSKDGINYQSGTTFSGLTPGASYSFTVRNAAGCVSSATVRTIDAVPAPPAPPTLTGNNPGCTTLGSITVTNPTGAAFTYSKDGVTFQGSPIFGSLQPGTYNIRVKNAAGCVSAPATYTINPGPATPAQPTVVIVQTTCTTTTGSITVTAPSDPGLTYSIDGNPYQASNTFNNVLPGPHTITVQNAAGCISPVRTATINPVPLAPDVPQLAAYHPGCNAVKGSISVLSPIGNGITYSIDGGPYVANPAFTNLDPGTHTITVKNAAGCISAPASEVINTPPATPDAPVLNITQPNCNSATGSITVVSPLDTGLVYSVNSLTPQSNPTFNNLVPGNYVITARNAAGCISGYTHFIISYPPLTPAEPAVTVTQPDCDTPVGRIVVNSPAGVGLEYSLSGGPFQPSRIFDALAQGTYTITVRNSAGCTATLTGVSINASPAPAPSPGVITGDNAVCEGGTIQLNNTVPDGVWSSSNEDIATVAADGLVTTLKAGTVIITYNVGTVCTAKASHTITVHSLPLPALRNMFLCVDNQSGAVIPGLLMSGLSDAAYTFEWKRNGTLLPQTTAFIMINEAGDYSVKVTNTITGCETTSTATVGLSSLALGYAEAKSDFHHNQTIMVHITGGSGDYEYSLDGGPFQDEPYFSDIYEGEYHISVRDKNGCGTLELDVFALNYPRFFSPNGDGIRDTWNINGLSLQPGAKIYIFDRYGKVIAGIKPGGTGWDGTYNGARLPATDYWFTLEYTSANGEAKEFKAHFSLLR